MVLVLSGRIEGDDVHELRKAIEGEPKGSEIALDLDEVRLVDRDAITYLAACEDDGVKLRRCPSYIRNWIAARKNKGHEF